MPASFIMLGRAVQMHDLIQVEYVLVSGDSDWKAPDSHRQYLDDKKWVLAPATAAAPDTRGAPLLGAGLVLRVAFPPGAESFTGLG